MAKSYLTSQQIQSWHEQGFLVVPGAVDPQTVTQLRRQAEELTQELRDEWGKAPFSTRDQARNSNAYFLNSGPKISIFMENTEPALPNKIGHALHELDPVFREFCHRPEWARIAADLGMEDPGLLQSMYIFKYPKVGGEVAAHQDSAFLYTEPLSVVGFWFAMENATRENACLWALPGGHREALRQRFVRRENEKTGFKVLRDEPLPTEGYVPIEVEAGSLVLLHGQLPHWSAANESRRSREAFTLHVIERQAHYPDDNWLQRPAAMVLKTFGEA